MSRMPWFKFWPADYLCDSDVQKLPLEAQGMLLRMWCVCHIEGSLPSDPEELAVLVRCKLQSVLLSYPLCKPFFELRDGKLYSRRMEREKQKSEIARANAKAKHSKGTSAVGSANGSANSSAKSPAQKAREPESQIEREDLSLVYSSDEAPDDLESKVMEVWEAYPTASVGKRRAPGQADQQAIAQAIVTDGFDVVLAGTRNYRGAVEKWPAAEQKFIRPAFRFFGGSDPDYRKNPAIWEKSVGAIKGVQPAASLGLSAVERQRRSIAEYEARQAAEQTAKAAHA